MAASSSSSGSEAEPPQPAPWFILRRAAPVRPDAGAVEDPEESSPPRCRSTTSPRAVSRITALTRLHSTGTPPAAAATSTSRRPRPQGPPPPPRDFRRLLRGERLGAARRRRRRAQHLQSLRLSPLHAPPRWPDPSLTGNVGLLRLRLRLRQGASVRHRALGSHHRPLHHLHLPLDDSPPSIANAKWDHHSLEEIWEHDSYARTEMHREVPVLALVHPSKLAVVYFFLEQYVFSVDVSASAVEEFAEMPGPVALPWPINQHDVLAWRSTIIAAEPHIKDVAPAEGHQRPLAPSPDLKSEDEGST